MSQQMKQPMTGYDQRQVIDARLITCTVCQRQYYMTKPAAVCIRCQQAKR